MKQSLQIRLSQQLTMTPQLQQAIRLLQLSSIELEQEVQQALESNMMLELDDDAGGGSDSDPRQKDVAGGGDSDTGPVEHVAEAAESGSALDADIPEELPVDTAWDDIYDGAVSAGATVSGDGGPLEYENQTPRPEGLHEHLIWQLNLTPMSEADRAIATTIVDAIDDDGYLKAGPEELAEALGRGPEDPVDPGEIEAVLAIVQSLDPAGIGARDLRECLLLQLKQLEPATRWLAEARTLVANHLDLLGARDFQQIMRRMKLDKESLTAVVHLIQSLNPRPGAQLAEPATEYVVPDVYVRKHSGTWTVELNPDAVPHLRVNQRYAAMIRRADNSADNNSLKAHLQEARWLIKSLQSRSETLLRVASAIVERQRAFFEYGEEAMKPLVLHDIAEALGMHESTISRVTTRKYMHSPRGIFELKYFFSSHVSTDQGGEASSTAIRAVIKKFIGAENPSKPLSDSQIAGLLQEQGINVARRTVAKYREAMGISPSNERRRLA
ncbi:MAG: RNA polymerase factor sigma-54 [Gammaproteobacteria bacterium]